MESTVTGTLSPSRAADFTSCPLRYRFRVVDGLPDEPTPEATRGTLVHRVLELLFDDPAAARTPARAEELLTPAWSWLVEQDRRLADLFGPDASAFDAWWRTCVDAVHAWFRLEDPVRLEPAEREAYLEAPLDSGLVLRGIVDRLDVAADGRVRVVDYKTGRAPHPGFEAAALFQLRFYALLLWRARGVVPSVLQLVYLGSGEILRHAPDEAELLATERRALAIWAAIDQATRTGDWRPRRSALCSWCSHQSLCPEFGGTPPPLPDPGRRPPA
ncbi:RecB family exonuclease [Nocardioides solisilvae]|uniref:RecB family exonuclease n=1 Tax=Nocardioides solisilvae TaxID=1542435 RepID=UPI000D74646B|nr:PD-(D/E)XK nuclease family protein [Nocardioides solisilvae]